MTEHVAVSREDGGVLLVRLTRPEKKNALTGAMYDALTAALLEADGGEEIGAIVLAGSGGVFTAGNDLGDFLSFAQGGGTELPASRFIRQLARTKTPLVAAIEGLAIGVGTTLTYHCDLVYAAPGALFRMPFVDLGLVPELGSSMIVPWMVGRQKAAELMLLGDFFSAEMAKEMGFVNRIMDRAELLPNARATAAVLAAKPPEAMRLTRRLLRQHHAILLERMEEERNILAAQLRTDETQAIMANVLKKR